MLSRNVVALCKNRLEKCFQPVTTVQEYFGDPDPATDNSKDSQDNQRKCNCCRALVQVVLLIRSSPKLSKKSHGIEAEHIKGGHHRSQNTNSPKKRVGRISRS